VCGIGQWSCSRPRALAEILGAQSESGLKNLLLFFIPVNLYEIWDKPLNVLREKDGRT
jgi:hypothetical protein